MYKLILKPIFFQMSPEKAHYTTMRLFRFALSLPFGKWIFKQLYVPNNPKLERKLMGLSFPNPVGLAAGFDKDGKFINDLAYLGFGFIEIGTVTPQPQDGNPKPRLFRLPEHEALINRMGFNNEGVEKLVERLKAYRTPDPEGETALRVIVGGNIGKNKVTPNEEAFRDYEICFEEACLYGMPLQLCRLFVIILAYCSPKNPSSIWLSSNNRRHLIFTSRPC